MLVSHLFLYGRLQFAYSVSIMSHSANAASSSSSISSSAAVPAAAAAPDEMDDTEATVDAVDLDTFFAIDALNDAANVPPPQSSAAAAATSQPVQGLDHADHADPAKAADEALAASRPEPIRLVDLDEESELSLPPEAAASFCYKLQSDNIKRGYIFRPCAVGTTPCRLIQPFTSSRCYAFYSYIYTVIRKEAIPSVVPSFVVMSAGHDHSSAVSAPVRADTAIAASSKPSSAAAAAASGQKADKEEKKNVVNLLSDGEEDEEGKEAVTHSAATAAAAASSSSAAAGGKPNYQTKKRYVVTTTTTAAAATQPNAKPQFALMQASDQQKSRMDSTAETINMLMNATGMHGDVAQTAQDMVCSFIRSLDDCFHTYGYNDGPWNRLLRSAFSRQWWKVVELLIMLGVGGAGMAGRPKDWPTFPTIKQNVREVIALIGDRFRAAYPIPIKEMQLMLQRFVETCHQVNEKVQRKLWEFVLRFFGKCPVSCYNDGTFYSAMTLIIDFVNEKGEYRESGAMLGESCSSVFAKQAWLSEEHEYLASEFGLYPSPGILKVYTRNQIQITASTARAMFRAFHAKYDPFAHSYTPVMREHSYISEPDMIAWMSYSLRFVPDSNLATEADLKRFCELTTVMEDEFMLGQKVRNSGSPSFRLDQISHLNDLRFVSVGSHAFYSNRFNRWDAVESKMMFRLDWSRLESFAEDCAGVFELFMKVNVRVAQPLYQAIQELSSPQRSILPSEFTGYINRVILTYCLIPAEDRILYDTNLILDHPRTLESVARVNEATAKIRMLNMAVLQWSIDGRRRSAETSGASPPPSPTPAAAASSSSAAVAPIPAPQPKIYISDAARTRGDEVRLQLGMLDPNYRLPTYFNGDDLDEYIYQVNADVALARGARNPIVAASVRAALREQAKARRAKAAAKPKLRSPFEAKKRRTKRKNATTTAPAASVTENENDEKEEEHEEPNEKSSNKRQKKKNAAAAATAPLSSAAAIAAAASSSSSAAAAASAPARR